MGRSHDSVWLMGFTESFIGRWRPFGRVSTPGKSCLCIFHSHLFKVMSTKVIKKTQSGKFSGLKIINHDVAGIDVGATLMQVCVPAGRDENNNRAFGTCTKELKAISLWLKGCRVTKVLMESTGVYWTQLFRVLQEDGFDVYLVNAADAKNMSGRKTDVDDAEWLMVLLAYGMFKPCYQSDASSRKLRTFTRLREQYVESSATAVQRMQKSLELMNVKLTEVISNIVGMSGTKMIEAILGGERAPETLAAFADTRCKATREELAASMEGTWDEDHMFALSMAYDDYKTAQRKISACDAKIEETAASMTSSVRIPEENRVKSGKRAYKKNAMNVNVEEYCYRAFGVNIMAIPGVSSATALAVLSELGPGFVDKFPSANKFCKWCNLAPNDKITGGKIVSSKMLKRKNKVGQALRQSAMSLARSKEALGSFYRRMKSRTGGIQANVAVAHRLAKIIYHMIKNKTEYDAEKVSKPSLTMLEKRRLKLLSSLRKLDESIAAIS